jgi:phosphate starvation-inducible PhoH-like protein
MASKLRGSTRDKTTRSTRSATNRGATTKPLPEFPELRETKIRAESFKPANEAQKRYKIQNNTVTFGIGPAGTGKSYCAAYAAAEMLKNREVDKIIITRPVVEAGEELGFLPGDMNEKFAPYVAPIVECLGKMLGKSHVEALIENGKIVMLPLAYMRGHSFNNAFVILDEAQNVSRKQMLLFLTRIGKDSTIVVDGDCDQRDLDVDGLEDAIRRLDRTASVGVHEFSLDDIVRSGIVRDVIRAYSTGKLKVDIETADTDDELGEKS